MRHELYSAAAYQSVYRPVILSTAIPSKLMSIQIALQFIHQLRTDEELKNRLFVLNDSPNLESFVKLGAEIGLIFTVEELKAAHKHDWAMRWLLYNR
jgi:hypothetical protein